MRESRGEALMADENETGTKTETETKTDSEASELVAADAEPFLARRYKIFLVVTAVTLILDQVTKWWARASLVEHKAVAFLGSFWEWELSYNPGSAFGLFRNLGGARVWLSIIGVLAFVAIIFILRKANDKQKWMTTALALVGGGAIGNVIDRVMLGKVTDFVVWRAGSHQWPAFNIADAALVAGVLILFLDVGREQKKAKEEKLKADRAKEVRPGKSKSKTE
jgi:signal peptidase II